MALWSDGSGAEQLTRTTQAVIAPAQARDVIMERTDIDASGFADVMSDTLQDVELRNLDERAVKGLLALFRDAVEQAAVSDASECLPSKRPIVSM